MEALSRAHFLGCIWFNKQSLTLRLLEGFAMLQALINLLALVRQRLEEGQVQRGAGAIYA